MIAMNGRYINGRVIGYGLLLIAGIIAPRLVYPVFLMRALCFALFACAFNLLLGYTGLLSFGHAAFFGVAGYATGWIMKTIFEVEGELMTRQSPQAQHCRPPVKGKLVQIHDCPSTAIRALLFRKP
jgi:ABC-type branched-subunit amino acid transport system permease subunit